MDHDSVLVSQFVRRMSLDDAALILLLEMSEKNKKGIALGAM